MVKFTKRFLRQYLTISSSINVCRLDVDELNSHLMNKQFTLPFAVIKLKLPSL